MSLQLNGLRIWYHYMVSEHAIYFMKCIMYLLVFVLDSKMHKQPLDCSTIETLGDFLR